MKIVDEQGTNIIGQFDMKKGSKYNVQIDLNEDLAERYEEMDRQPAQFFRCAPVNSTAKLSFLKLDFNKCDFGNQVIVGNTLVKEDFVTLAGINEYAYNVVIALFDT